MSESVEEEKDRNPSKHVSRNTEHMTRFIIVYCLIITSGEKNARVYGLNHKEEAIKFWDNKDHLMDVVHLFKIKVLQTVSLMV